MLHSLLAFFIFQSTVYADYLTQENNYEYTEQWPTNAEIEVRICDWHGSKIKDQDVIEAVKFWNKKDTYIKIKKLIKVKDCNYQQKRNIILISDLQEKIDRDDEYGMEVTYTKKGTDIITKSYVEINTDNNISKQQIKRTIFHELGHSLGIKHCNNCKFDDIMHH